MCDSLKSAVNGVGIFVAGLTSPALMKPPTEYGFWLSRATRVLGRATFGDWRGFDAAPPSVDPSNPSVPERNFAKDKYDKSFWNAISFNWHGYTEVLEVKEGLSPAAAIDAIISHPDRWRIDCDHTVQIANLYATMQTRGVDAFNEYIVGLAFLAPRYSTGLATKLHYARNIYDWVPPQQWRWRQVRRYIPPGAQPREPLPKNGDPPPPKPLPSDFEFEPGDLGDVTVEELLRSAPPGSRVRWTNLAAPPSHEFRHENAVKLQPDLYAAGGLWTPAGNEYSRANLEKAMQTVPGQLFIDEIEIFEMHG